MSEEYITVADAARIAEVTQDAVRKAIRTGKLPATEKYGRLLLLPADVDAWNERRVKEIGRPPKPRIG